jgi:hypothetical protein
MERLRFGSCLDCGLVPEVGVDRTFGCGEQAWPYGKSRVGYQHDRCTAYDCPQVMVRGCAHRAQSTFP